MADSGSRRGLTAACRSPRAPLLAAAPTPCQCAGPSCGIPRGDAEGTARPGSPGCRPTGRGAWDRAPSPEAEGQAAAVSGQRQAPGWLESTPSCVASRLGSHRSWPPGGPGVHTCVARGPSASKPLTGVTRCRVLRVAGTLLGTGWSLDGPPPPGWSSPGVTTGARGLLHARALRVAWTLSQEEPAERCLARGLPCTPPEHKSHRAWWLRPSEGPPLCPGPECGTLPLPRQPGEAPLG